MQFTRNHIDTSGPTQHGRFVSLKWKTIFLFGMATALASLSFTYISYNNVRHLQSLHQEQENRNNQEQLNGLLALSYDSLAQTAAYISPLSETIAALQGKETKFAGSAMKKIWQEIELHTDLSSIQVYNRNRELVSRFGRTTHHSTDSLMPIPQSLLQQVALHETPVRHLSCMNECLLVTAYPVLYNGKNAGTITVASGIADILHNFYTITGHNIGILSTFKGDRTEQRRIDSWDMTVHGLTDQSNSQPLLSAISQQHGLPNGGALSRPFEFNERHYHFQLLPLSQPGEEVDVYAIILRDDTMHESYIVSSLAQTLGFSLSGLIATGLIVFFLTQKPLARLSTAATVLPRLAHEQAYKAITPVQPRATRYVDELDILDMTIVSLAKKLDELNTDVTHANDNLRKRMGELKGERDFIKSLMNTAEVAIATMDTKFNVLTANDFFKKLCGTEEKDMIRKIFSENFLKSRSRNEIRHGLKMLIEGKTEKFEHELTITSENNDCVSLTWVHSLLNDSHSTDQPIILSIGIDITARVTAERQLLWLADHDPLTGLANRHCFQKTLKKEIQDALIHQRSGAVLCLDLDNFKDINDTCGHHIGDKILKRVANRLAKIARKSDHVAHLGGDEFALILSDVRASQLEDISAKILGSITEITHTENNSTHRVKASMGIALFPESGLDTHELLANADMAMYQVKDNGKDGTYVYTKHDNTRDIIHERIHWRNQIDKALSNGDFVLHYQPIQHIASGSITHYEALLRMQLPNGELVYPDKFIPVAEHTGIISAIDNYVVEHAIRELADINRSQADIRMSVNISGHALKDKSFIDVIERALSQYECSPRNLIFELTETTAVADLSSARQLIHDIKAIGCDFALDDFGVGYSSFYYVKQLPFDYIKIDGSFIRNMRQNKEDLVFVKALSEMAVAFGKKTIAEFVEDDVTLHQLAQLGIHYAQGYHIGKPSPDLVDARQFKLAR